MPPATIPSWPEGNGGFNYYLDGQKEGSMIVKIKDDTLIAVHTEVDEKLEGKGVGGRLLEAMVNYAREKHYRVVPKCTYVHTMFKRNPEKYEDLTSQK